MSVPERPRRTVGDTGLLSRRQGGLWRKHDDRARLGQVLSPSTGSARRPTRSLCLSRGFGRRLVGIAPAGLPIAARVSVEPTEPGGFTALDRVLLQARGNDTDPAGNFEFLITSPTKVVLRLSTWFGMGPSQTDHVREISLATVPAQFGLDGEPIVVKSPKAPVVRCTITGPPDARPEIDELGISFAPHDAPTGRKGQYFGHSGSCAMVGGHSGDPSRATPREVAFIWPGGTEALCIEARPVPGTLPPGNDGQPRSLLGIIMTRATDPCQIPVKPLEPQK